MTIIDDFISKDLSDKGLYQQSSYDNVPEYEFWRRLRRCIPPDIAKSDKISIERAREMIDEAVDDYRLLDDPNHMLLVRALPGIGKTFVGVAAAEREALSGRYVAYAGPRHDFFQDIMAIAKYPAMWYEWNPRTRGDESGIGRTCDYADEINRWLAKGYDAMDFCSGICGWDFVKNGCPYHRQKLTQQERPITFIQHSHVSLGHPLRFDLLIGDENPTESFLHKWRIPTKNILPDKMMPSTALYNLLTTLTGVSAGNAIVEGTELLDRLGGPEKVIKTFEESTVPWDAIAAGDIHSLEEAEYAGYFHLPKLSGLLMRESKLAITGSEYIHRIIAGKDGLTMLLRHDINEKMPARRIWLDATGNQHIYSELFNQRVETIDISPKLKGTITVVTDRANGKGVLDGKRQVDNDRHIEQVDRLITRITEQEEAQRVGIVSFQNIISENKLLSKNREVLNFYGARGTNRLENVDALFVVGTPMPEQSVYKSIGAMIYFGRDLPFNDTWSSIWLPYNYVDADGAGYEYPAGGFWGDRDLQALLWQMREAEIIQAVHRSRPLLHPVSVYLLTNLPILEMPIDRLMSSAELFGAPKGVDIYRWSKFVEWMDGQDEVTTSDIVKDFGKMKLETARKYLQFYVENNPGWEIAAIKTGRRGNPPMGARRENNEHLVNCERSKY